MILKENDIWALSFTITGKCNCDCSYCHFYANRDRKKYNINMDYDLFMNYVELIKFIKKTYHKELQIRFSGGEPLMIGENLFKYSNIIYRELGYKPYVLTNGKLLDEDIIEKAYKANISAFLVSIENPYDQSENAPSTDEVLEKIRKYNKAKVPVLPAIMVVKNEYFDKLFEICNYVYERTKILPSFSELTYHAFQIPTEEDINALYSNIFEIAKKYYKVTPIRMFPYLSPELYANNQKNYLSELDIENSIGITNDNIESVAKNMFLKLNRSYIKNPCRDSECEWFEDCKFIKWLWLYTYNDNISLEQKLDAFCRMRKALNKGLFDGIMANKRGENLGKVI